MTRTEREIAWRLEQIGIEFDQNLSISAKLHGVEYKPKAKEVAVKLSKEQEAKIDVVIKEALERKKAQYGNRS